MLYRTPILACALVCCWLSCIACGGGDDDDPAGAGGGSTTEGGRVTGTVSYAGSAQGDLIVAAFTEWPTVWAPEMFVKIPSPAFPQVYELDGLDPGDYYVFAFIDIPPVSPTLPGAEDIQSTPTATVRVSDTESATQDVALPRASFHVVEHLICLLP